MLNTITNIPAPRVSVIDERTGLMAREWYLFFLNLFTLTGSGQNTISLQDVQIGPPSLDVQPVPDSVAPLAVDSTKTDADIQALSLAAYQADLTEFDKALQAVNISPAQTPHLSLARYGSFYDTTDQTAAAINTAYAMTFNTTAESMGVYVGSPTSRIYVDRPALYNIQFSAQVLNTAGGAHAIWIWFRKNGSDVADSATKMRLQGNNTEAVAAWNFFIRLNAGDYFELMWEVDDVAVSLWADPASAVHPAIPSIILTVSDNIT